MQANEEFARSCANYSLQNSTRQRQAHDGPHLASADVRDTLTRRGFAGPATARR